MKVVKVGDISSQIRGVSYAKADASDRILDGYVPILRANNITDDGIDIDHESLIYVPSERVRKHQYLSRGDVLIAASSGSIQVVGKAATVPEDMNAAFGAFCKVLRPNKNEIWAPYFAHFFKTKRYRQIVSSLAEGANINNLKNEHLDNLQIPLPPLDEQKRIAAVLDAADALRAKRRAALAKLDTLLQAVFLEMFGDPVTNPMGWEVVKLGNVADIVSGVTKGQRFKDRPTRVVPYMRVANVQDGRLVLDDVKTIEALVSDVEKYTLQSGDLLLTEGGDPDKLGRGAIWKGEVNGCIHQNHIFRVRLTTRRLLPEYLSALIASQHGKRYFLRAAKQTTGIATINKTQLSRFPTQLPPTELQSRFCDVINEVELIKSSLVHGLSRLDHLFGSIQQSVFSGTYRSRSALSD